MFQRFNEEAHRVIFFARYEVSEKFQPAVTPEDILLGVVRVVKSVLKNKYGIADHLLLIDMIRDILPVSEVKQEGICLPLSLKAKEGVDEATAKAEIEVTPWFLLWVMYPSISPQVVGILETHGITRDSLMEKRLV